VCAGFGPLSVPTSGSVTLSPGSYGAVSLGPNATLRLSGGDYHVFSVSLAEGSSLLAGGSSLLQITTTLAAATRSVIGPDPALGVPINLRIEANGPDTAMSIGDNASVAAVLLAPNGTIQIGDNAALTGVVDGFRAPKNTPLSSSGRSNTSGWRPDSRNLDECLRDVRIG
jgi:hypothetical protein